MAQPVKDKPRGLLRDFKSLASVVEAIPFGWLVISQIAMNHLRSGSLVSANIVPTLIENRCGNRRT